MPARDLIADVVANGPALTDGAWGTQFLAMGLSPGELGDGWNLSHPDRVETVARSYVEAGSRIILTNTFRSNRIALTPHGLADKVRDLNSAGVAISRRAANGRALVFASMGTSGKLLLSGDVTLEELAAAFGEQAQALASAGADAVVLETMTDLAETTLAVHAVHQAGLPVVASMVFDSGKNRDRTMMGATPEQVAAELSTAGADVIGANCGQGIEGYVEICRRLQAATERPLWIKPNAGLPQLAGGQPVYKTTPEEFASHIPSLIDAGADFIGGCCGTTPAFIRAIASKI